MQLDSFCHKQCTAAAAPTSAAMRSWGHPARPGKKTCCNNTHGESETRSSKKRRIALSPGGATATATVDDTPLLGELPPTSMPSGGDAIRQLNGAEETPPTPPAPPEREMTPGRKTPLEGCLWTAPPPPPPPPPMTCLTRCPYLVLSRRTHNISFKYCNRCN